jgi:transposase
VLVVYQKDKRSGITYAYESNAISSYSETLKQAQFGNNKEDDKLPQINLALVLGEESNLPFYYRKLAGNIPDVKTLKNLLAHSARILSQ